MSGIKYAFTFGSNCVDTRHTFCGRQRPPRKKASLRAASNLGSRACLASISFVQLQRHDEINAKRVWNIPIKINILCPCARLNCRFRVFNATQIDFVCNLTAHDCHMWHAPGPADRHRARFKVNICFYFSLPLSLSLSLAGRLLIKIVYSDKASVSEIAIDAPARAFPNSQSELLILRLAEL